MKKLVSVFVIFAILFVLPFSIAQPAEVGRNVIVPEYRETMPFKTNHGAEMRFVQLEKVIDRKIMVGELLLEKVDVSEEGLEEGNAILMSMEALKEDVSAYEVVGGSEDVSVFISFKTEAVNLVKAFKDVIVNFVSAAERDSLREEVEEEVEASGKLNAYDVVLEQKARAHNAEVVEEELGKFGIVGEELLQRIRTRDIEPKDIKLEVLSLIRSVRAERANEVIDGLMENAAKERIRANDEYARVKDEVLQEAMDRYRIRIEEVKSRFSEELAQRVNERLNNPALN